MRLGLFHRLGKGMVDRPFHLALSLANAARVQRAIELLRHTNGSIAQVSFELGYSTPSNFARAFRKQTGIAPRDFHQHR